jgi:alginate O-acetyltransferase complex protein AlgI
MIFGSLEFYLFMLTVFPLWLMWPPEKRWLLLLLASYLFYFFWKPWFAVILGYCSLLSWLAGIAITENSGINRKKAILAAAIILNLMPLFFFKYFNFINDSLLNFFKLTGIKYAIPHLDILLPVGISFYTFQAISYCVDVYKEKIKAEPNIGIFALYLAFFPKLISGPIERGANLLPQLHQRIFFDSGRFLSGMELFFWGVFKKMVIADRLGMYVDMVYSHPQDYWGRTAIIATWFFALQIYCDFSAYMDMAIGCGRIFGIELSRNFNFPYLAGSVAEFWQRWHITLTSWFRDYVYIPLGGNRLSSGRWFFNIMAVFLLSGLWHGAAWNFVWWGALHGLFYLFGKVTLQARGRLREILGIKGGLAAALQIFITFNLISLAWVFFRAATIDDAFCLIRHMFGGLSLPIQVMSSQFSTVLTFCFAILFVVMEIFHYWETRNHHRISRAIPDCFKYPLYATVLLAISLLGVSSNQFIYFHF